MISIGSAEYPILFYGDPARANRFARLLARAGSHRLARNNPAKNKQILLLHLIKHVEHLVNRGNHLGVGFERTLSNNHVS